ncbi:hypothetical protein ABZ023_25855 [Streptomyces sp. NPDC006367]|uniref:hypothetical protein n=1 Tax=unclassified Streptomyces TaxID=2593676 RepID=UPI0033AEA182
MTVTDFGPELASDSAEAVCTRCGCTDNAPCPGGCVWVANNLMVDLCSACAAEPETAELRRLVLELGSSALHRKAEVIATRSCQPKAAEDLLAHSTTTFLSCAVLRLLELALRLDPSGAEAVAAELHELRDDAPEELDAFLKGHADAMGMEPITH